MKNIRDDLKFIYSEAIASVNPENAIKNHISINNEKLQLLLNGEPYKEFNLNDYNNIYVVGSGKATAPMAKAIENILTGKITNGIISVKYDYIEKLNIIEIIEASHPAPDENGVRAASKIRSLLFNAKEDDLVISLISGGGSALLPLPPESITLNEKRETTELLLKSGATIHEINSIRKHLSLSKGGNLARAAYPASVINLMISDVVGDNMDVIASGPFVPDNSSFSGALETLKRYNLYEKIPESVKNYIESGFKGNIEENPINGDKVFNKITNLIIASNIIALEAAKKEAEKLGYNALVLSSMIEGETEVVSRIHSVIAKEVLLSSNPITTPACIISGGETTVTIKGQGLGGRSMEFAMHAALCINGYENMIIASVGTDGTDGPTDAAGAIADGKTVERAEKKRLNIYDYVNNNDSYNFFKKLDDLIITGPTNTNVMDIRIMLIESDS